MNRIQTISKTNFHFPGQTKVYHGKVRDVYTLEGNLLVMIASDRISAFDVVLPKGIPYKGQILNSIASMFLKATSDIVPNWLLATPDPNVSAGRACLPFKTEMVIRGYLCGHAWREYKSGKRVLCGVKMPDGMKENDRFPEPLITPSTKAEVGHDEDISREDIISGNIVSESDYVILEKYTRALFQRGTEIAAKRNLILADTKYEFGKNEQGIFLIDEIHTPDSSRYFYKEEYEENQKQNLPQKQLSKEFVREWLMANGFQGKEGQKVPEMTDEVVDGISKRYQELFSQITGEVFSPSPTEDLNQRIERNVINWLHAN